MTRDYKHSRARPPRGTPGWVWMLVGLSIGLVVALAVYLHGQKQLQELSRSSPVRPPAPVSEKSPPSSESQAQRRFDFYTLLPELEVVVPEEPAMQKPRQTSAPQPPPEKSKPQQVPPRGGYILQVGSFRRLEDADSLRARLTLMGLGASIQTVRVDRDTWHRVRVGPYADLAEANRVRERLRKNQVDAILLKARG